MRTLLLFLLLPMARQEGGIQDLIRRLGNDSPEARDRAASALRALGDDAIPELKRALGHSDAEVRARVGGILRHLEWDGTLNPRLLSRYPPLRDAFERGAHSEVLDFCVGHPASSSWFNEGFEAFSVKLLDVPDLALRKRATSILHGLAERKDWISGAVRRPVRQLVSQIVSWDPDRCDDAHRGWLVSLTETVFFLASRRDLEVLLGACPGHPDARTALDLLRAGVGAEDFQPALVEVLESGPAWARALTLKIIRKVRYASAREAVLRRVGDNGLDWLALQAISEIMDGSCEAPLLEVYNRILPKDRSWIWYALLSKMGSAEAVPLLSDAFDSCDPNVRHLVLDALVDRKAEGLFDRLCAGLDDEKFCNYYSKAAAQLADARTVHRLLEMLELPEGRRRSSARWGLMFTQDPGAQREVLRRLERETRPALRKDLFAIATDYWFLKSGAEGLEPLLEGIAKTPADPLAAEAASHLARMRGREGVPQAEETLLAAREPSWALIAQLAQYPSDRLVDKVGRLAAEKKDGGWGIHYLENLGTEKARKELNRIRAAQKEETTFVVVSGGSYSALEDGGYNKTVDELKGFLFEYKKGRQIPTAKEEFPRTCGMGLTHNRTGEDALRALGAKQDRALTPLFMEHLKDPEAGLQKAAIRALGRLGAREAVPALRLIALSGDLRTRGEAIRALGAIGAPGTAEFLKAHLRDNPHAAPFALARLGCDCRAEVALLLEDDVQKGPILGALDLMANPGIYRNLDAPLPPRAPTQLEAFTSIIENATGVPCRVSRGVRAMLRSHDQSRTALDADTLREALEDMEGHQGYAGERFTTLYRNGTIGLCLVEEAIEHWKPRLPQGR